MQHQEEESRNKKHQQACAFMQLRLLGFLQVRAVPWVRQDFAKKSGQP